MKISRLFQPKNPLFWLLVVLNVLSMALSHVAQNFQLNTLGTILVVLTARRGLYGYLLKGDAK